MPKITLAYYPPRPRMNYTHQGRADQSVDAAITDTLNRLYDSMGVVDNVVAVQVDGGDWQPLHIVRGDDPGTWRQVLDAPPDAPPTEPPAEPEAPQPAPVPVSPRPPALLTEAEAYAERSVAR